MKLTFVKTDQVEFKSVYFLLSNSGVSIEVRGGGGAD